jgi:UDP-2-acetamido-3-amino-2,3-dideoxy-glucuronate N-acetyltransferase
MSTNPHGVALVGHGVWGRNLARNFHSLGVLRAVCEPDPDRREQVARLYPDAKAVATLDEALALGDVHAVACATPAETHWAVARAALLSGRDVFVEKPLALTAREGQELVELAREKGRILMVGHLMEYHPAVIALTELVDRGDLGNIRYIYSNRLNWGKVRREENILWSFAPHDIAIILRLLREKPSEVAAFGGSYLHPHIADVTVTNMAFVSGVRAHIFVSWLHPYKEQRLVVVGDKRVAAFEDSAGEGKLALYSHTIDWVDRVPVARKADAELVPLDDTEPLRVECEAFLRAVATRVPPVTDGANGVRVLEVLELCQRSLEAGGAVQKPARPSLVHETAVVDRHCRIGEGTRVWHFSHIMSDARIGRDCVIGQNAFIARGVVIGDRCKLQNNVSVYEGVELEDEVFCGPSMVFTNVRNPRAHVNRREEFERTLVGRGATLGANCTVRCGVTIGHHAFVAAGAVVTRDVPPHALVMGNPGRVTGWMCDCGERLPLPAAPPEGAEAACPRCSARYRMDAGLRAVSG